VEQDRELIRHIRVRGSDKPTSDQLLEVLCKAMRRPMIGSGKRIRPARILSDDAELVQELAPQLAEVGVQCEYRASLPLLDDLSLMLTAGPRLKQEPVPGLLSIGGAAEPLLHEFFTAAAAYYRQSPWQRIENWDPIEVRYPPESPPRYALVLGSGGEFFGLSLYESRDHLRLVFSNPEPERTCEQVPWVSVVFEEAMTMAFEDLDAIEKYGWPVAGERAYPATFRTTPPGEWGLPSALDLAWLAAALRAIPDFLVRHAVTSRGLPRPAEAIFSLPEAHGNHKVALHYPVSLADPEEEMLEEYIQDWHADEPSHEFARQVGAFLFEFMDHLATTGLAESTLRKHESNCWAIGYLECQYGCHDTFSPQIFAGEPAFLYEFERKFSDSKYAVASYQATWRKLARYARSVRGEGDKWQPGGD
jgi:hypothetical protein